MAASAPRKAAVPRKAVKPAAPAPPPPDVTLNLDALEREGGDPEPFTFLYNGRVFQMRDPGDVDWQDLMQWDLNPLVAVRGALVDGVDEFFASPMKSWRMQALQRAYLKHFGLPTPGNPAALPAS